MSYNTVEIKSLPLTDEVKDEDLVIVEKPNFTAAAPAGLLKNYLVNELNNTLQANTYTADGVTLELSGGQFKVKDGSIGDTQLDADIKSRLGTAGTISGAIKTYTNPISALEEYLEIAVQPSPGAALQTYAIRVYKVV